MCTGNCNQGRNCDCAPRRYTTPLNPWAFTLAIIAWAVIVLLIAGRL